MHLIALLHARFASHAVLAECRSCAPTANVRDAVRALESLRGADAALTEEQAAPRTVSSQTLPHGDLGTPNAIVSNSDGGLEPRLIDWDHAGVGPASYDLSTFLLRFPPGRRKAILDFYASRSTARERGGYVIVSPAFEAPAVVAGLDDVAVVGQAIEQHSCHFGIAEHRRILPFLIG